METIETAIQDASSFFIPLSHFYTPNYTIVFAFYKKSLTFPHGGPTFFHGGPPFFHGAASFF